MFEGVFRVGRAAASEDQLGPHELRQGVVQLLLRQGGYSADQLMRELPPKRRSDLRHLAHRRHPIEPRKEGGVERRRDGQQR
jgi:hypothetical protein